MCGTSLVDANYGRVIGGRYVVHQRIGAGSAGAVYRGVQHNTGRNVAIKLLSDSDQDDPAGTARFEREAQVLLQLRSQHTINIYDFNREPDGTLYIVMELSPGRTLSNVLRREGPLLWPRVLRILLALCDSLGEAHSLGIIHRDLTPRNILLEERATNLDFVKVSDFGLAKILGASVSISPAGATVGSVEYASPESLMRRPIDGRSDLYALGILGYLLVTGTHPFSHARSYGDMVAAHVQATPPPLSSLRAEVPADVEALLATLMQKDAARRYPDAATVAAQLKLMLSMLQSDVGPGMTVRTDEGEEETFLADIPARPK